MWRAFRWVFHSVVPLFSSAVRIFSLLLRSFYRSSHRCFRKGGEWLERGPGGRRVSLPSSSILYNRIARDIIMRHYDALGS